MLTVALVAAVAIPAYLILRRDHASALTQTRVSGIPASVSTSLANLMVLSPVPGARAPGFTLTDQNGHTMSLASLHGKAVVLQFMDPHCTDICPIVSAEFVKAYHDLGPLASKVVFAAVNVNAYHARVQDMAKYTRAQALNTIPSWHFFTGPVPALKAVWRGYNIQVYAPTRTPTSSTPRSCTSSTRRAGSATWPHRMLTTPSRARPTCPPASRSPGATASPWSPASSPASSPVRGHRSPRTAA